MNSKIMAFHDNGIRYQLKSNTSYSSLPAGLEIAVAPRRSMSSPEKTSHYTHKPLPSLPGKSSNQLLGYSASSNSLDIATALRISTFPVAKRGHDGRGSIKKIENLLGHKLDPNTRQPILDKLARHSNYEEPPQLPEIVRLSKLEYPDHGDTLSDIIRYMRSDPEHSLHSASEYSQDDSVEDIVDIYSKWGSWAPNSESPTSPVKRSFYLFPNMYSASATELGYVDHTSNIRRPSRASLDSSQMFSKAATITELISEERERLEAINARGKSWLSRGDRNASFNNHIFPEADELRYLSWNEDSTYRQNYGPQPLALRQGGIQEPHRSMSRWSDHSSDGGMISNARDSVISHIRSMSSPFRVPSRPSIVFKDKAVTSTIQAPSPEQPKRKMAFSSGKHPLKSPFPFRSPLHKRADSDVSPTHERSSFTLRISDGIKRFSGSRRSSIINSRIISNHARSGDGPDTPMPTKHGLTGMISPTAILFQKGTMQIQGAVQKAKRAAKIKSSDERRRDNLRQKIVVVGTGGQPPIVSRWV